MVPGDEESPSSRIFFSAKRVRKSLSTRVSVDGWLDWEPRVDEESVLFDADWDLLVLESVDFTSDGNGFERREYVSCHDPLELGLLEDIAIAE